MGIPRLRSVLRVGHKFSLGLVFALLLVEAGIRLLPLGVPDGVLSGLSIHARQTVMENHPQLGWALQPGLAGEPMLSADYKIFHVTTVGLGEDRTGFRGPHTLQPEGVVVGDSFVFGFGVEEEQSLPAQLSALLGAPWANFGAYGYGPQQAGLVLREYALPRKPQVALWVFFENDLIDAHKYQSNPPAPGPRGGIEASGDWHNRFWAGFKFWRSRSPYFSSRREHYVGGEVDLILNYNPFEELDLERAEVQAGLEITQAALARFQQDCEKAGVKPLLALMPFKETVYREEFEAMARREVKWPVLDETRAQVATYARSIALETIDLTPLLRKQRGRAIFQPADAHLSVLGNQLVAEGLAEFIREAAPKLSEAR